MVTFQSVRPENVDGIPGELNATICVLDTCPSCFINVAREEMAELVSDECLLAAR